MRFFIPSGRGGATIPSMDPQWAPTILRVHVGLAFLLYHGAHKVAELASGGSRFVDAVAALGFPAPLLFAWLAAGVQTVAAVLLLVGLASRLAALALAGTMFVALLETWPAGYLASEAALLYALLGALLAATGPGRLALENLHDRPVSRAPTGNPSPDHSRNGTLQSVQTISIEELREQLATGGVDEFWNVLTDEYFSGELIPGSRRVPLDRVGRELAGARSPRTPRSSCTAPVPTARRAIRRRRSSRPSASRTSGRTKAAFRSGRRQVSLCSR